jgi:hypothetical protein
LEQATTLRVLACREGLSSAEVEALHAGATALVRAAEASHRAEMAARHEPTTPDWDTALAETQAKLLLLARGYLVQAEDSAYPKRQQAALDMLAEIALSLGLTGEALRDRLRTAVDAYAETLRGVE